MTPRRRTASVVASLLMVVSLTVGAALVGVAPAAADEHTKDTARDLTEEANFTVNFPFTTDHYPGDQNEENGSIQYFAVGEDAFREVSDEEGVYLDYVIIDADWIDYSACSTDNTAAFGIDRGNDNEGTEIDEDLVQYQKNVDFRDDGLTVDFYSFEDFANDPPYMEANDAVVAEQGARSGAGACLTVTDEPGWYQLQGFINGTEADNGQGERPSGDADSAGINARSNYLYVCECDSRAAAEERLGPAPDDDSGGSTPTATPEDTPTETESDGATPTVTPTADGETAEAAPDTPEPTETIETAGGADATTTTDRDAATEVDGDDAGGESDDGAVTPTPADGPGFTGLVAVLALLASAGLLYRRD